MGSVENFRKVADIVASVKEEKIVVLSAMSGVTNTLVEIAGHLTRGEDRLADALVEKLHEKYLSVAEELLESPELQERARDLLNEHYRLLASLSSDRFTETEERLVLAKGELISTTLFQLLLEELGHDSSLLPALDFMRIDQNGEPRLDVISDRLNRMLERSGGCSTHITQGYICRNSQNEIDNLRRGGSDYSASLIGAALNARQIQIWTDIDGMHNNDPRYVEHTHSVAELSFDEAAELAYFGAKILHPQSIIPAKERNIPVLLKNTFRPESAGTLIHQGAPVRNIRAIAAKDNITAIKIKSYRMLMAYGFLKKVFEVFERYKTPIDMITTSEVAVSLTIDNTARLPEITKGLQGFGTIDVDTDLSIICIAGDISQNKKGITAAIFGSLRDIPIRMISYGGSNYNLSFLVKTSDKVAVLNLLNRGLFAARTSEEPALA